MKAKKLTPAKLKKKLDTVFSQYIRLRDCQEGGQSYCRTCPKQYQWNELQCGHFVPRNRLATRFDEQNCISQCWYCNDKRMGNGMPHIFAPLLQDLYGDEILNELKNRSQLKVQYKSKDYEELIFYYNSNIKELKKLKNINLSTQ